MLVYTALLFALAHSWENSATCGRRDEPSNDGRRKLITNGQEAKPYEFPWQVGLNEKEGDGAFFHFCGGSILNEEWIITAAHCFITDEGVLRYQAEQIAVIAGDYNYNEEDTDAREVIDVAEIITYPCFKGDIMKGHDIALLKLASPLTLSTSSPWKKNSVCLPNPSADYPYGEEVLVSGWGKLDDASVSTPITMNWNAANLRNDQYCLALRGEKFYIPDDQICFDRYQEPDSPAETLYDTGEGDCTGDSGGPLVHKAEDGKFYQYGANSNGLLCGNLLSAGVHTEVPKYDDWISSTVANYGTNTADGITCPDGRFGATTEEPSDDSTANPSENALCDTQSTYVNVCVQNFLAMKCSQVSQPACFSDWMETCDVGSPDCTSTIGDGAKPCSIKAIKTYPSVAFGSPYCDDSCETCGFYLGESWNLSPFSENDCVTCPNGFEIEPMHADCSGKCVAAGSATHSLSCTPPEGIECMLDRDGVPPTEPDWTGDECANVEVSDDYSFLWCDTAESCSYPIEDVPCAEDFKICRQEEHKYYCVPNNVDDAGPRQCEQCFHQDTKYIFGECQNEATINHYYPTTELRSLTYEGCPLAREKISKQINCIRKRSAGDCAKDCDCFWSESAQLCYYESLITLSDATKGSTCSDSDKDSAASTVAVMFALCFALFRIF